MKDGLGFIDAIKETQRLCGDPPLIGTFEPQTGDIGRDAESRLWTWDGTRWFDSKGNPAKTFGEWMDLR